MSEDEWLYHDWPKSMLELLISFAKESPPRLNYQFAERQLRLAACAACRKIERLLDEPRRQLVELAEKFALGQLPERDFRKAARKVPKPVSPKDVASGAHYYAALATASIADDAKGVVGVVMSASLCDRDCPEPLTSYCASILRCLFNNPFRSPVTDFDPTWRADTVMALARTMYESREFSAMPILADALQDAGCDNDDILANYRDPKQVHVRGCWVVDLVLGKS